MIFFKTILLVLLLSQVGLANDLNNPCRKLTRQDNHAIDEILRILDQQKLQRAKAKKKKRKEFAQKKLNKRKTGSSKKAWKEKAEEIQLDWSVREFAELYHGNLVFSLKTIVMDRKNYVEVDGEKIVTLDAPSKAFIPIRIVVQNAYTKKPNPQGKKVIALEPTKIGPGTIEAAKVKDLVIRVVGESGGFIELEIVLDGSPIWEGSFDKSEGSLSTFQ